MSDAISGHGVQVAVELDPAGAPGVFTTLGEHVGDLSQSWSRGTTESTPHDETIDSHVPDGRFTRDTIDLSVNRIYGATDQEGILDLFFANTKFGLKVTGTSSGAGAGTDEVIYSGFCTNFNDQSPVREGVRTAEITFQPSGPMIVDGTTQGA